MPMSTGCTSDCSCSRSSCSFIRVGQERPRLHPSDSAFRVRNKKETRYCYSEQERVRAIEALSPKPEITRFKGLGEISPDEFAHFIGKNIRLEPVMLGQEETIHQLLDYYMGKNTPDRQEFIITNLRYREGRGQEDRRNRGLIRSMLFRQWRRRNYRKKPNPPPHPPVTETRMIHVNGMYQNWFLDYASLCNPWNAPSRHINDGP